MKGGYQKAAGEEVCAHSLSEIASSCLDKTRFKFTEYVSQSVVEVALAFESNEMFLW